MPIRLDLKGWNIPVIPYLPLEPNTSSNLLESNKALPQSFTDFGLFVLDEFGINLWGLIQKPFAPMACADCIALLKIHIEKQIQWVMTVRKQSDRLFKIVLGTIKIATRNCILTQQI